MTGNNIIFLAAGGTGGHVFPAIAAAAELQKRGHEILFLTDIRGEKYLKNAGYKYKVISSASPNGPVAGAKLIYGILQAGIFILCKRPKLVIGFGGYPSFPPLMAAKFLGRKTILHEQNSILGKANRFLAGYANIVATSFPDTKNAANATFTGNPVRGEITTQAYPSFGGKLNVLITGGSQGAKLFADELPEALSEFASKISVTQQVRLEDFEKVKTIYFAADVEHDLKSFFTDMPERLKAAHLVICRAGASTICELAAIGRPALLVPLATSAENHQYHNACAISDIGGGWLLEEKDFNRAAISAMLQTLLQAPEELAQAAENIKKFAKLDAAVKLADLVEELIK